MAGGRPSAHFQSDTTNHLQRCVRVHPINPGQVHSGHPVQVAPDVEARLVLLPFLPVGFPCRRRVLAAVLESLQLGLYLQIVLSYLALVHQVQFQGLIQLEDVLMPPVAL